jgi:hypothetical protein
MLRSAEACRNRYQRQLVHRNTQRQGTRGDFSQYVSHDYTGKWSVDEELQLTQVIRVFRENGKVPETVPRFWKDVSERMDNVRTPDQCRNKWGVRR